MYRVPSFPKFLIWATFIEGFVASLIVSFIELQYCSTSPLDWGFSGTLLYTHYFSLWYFSSFAWVCYTAFVVFAGLTIFCMIASEEVCE